MPNIKLSIKIIIWIMCFSRRLSGSLARKAVEEEIGRIENRDQRSEIREWNKVTSRRFDKL